MILCCLLVKAVQNFKLVTGFSNLSLVALKTGQLCFFGYNHPYWTVVKIS